MILLTWRRFRFTNLTPIFKYQFTNNNTIMEEKPEEVKTIVGLSAKEIKKLVRPQFQANPEKYYPTIIFNKLGFSRTQCKCGVFYWRRSQQRTTCGDSKCVGKYTFIGKGTGIGQKGVKISYADAWKGFERSLTSSRIPCKSIQRYPVVARWRNDVDYVAAGIFCFQPYCVTGELDPPANPLICPQFCVRFNDLDNIGLTGRHYSGFVMLGIQVFNYPDKYTFFKEECVEFNYRWLTEQLGIDPNEITFIEDIWAGGGNLGPSVQYFVHGLELGNMVFMQFKYFPDGKYEELSIKIIDTGIGLERIPWLINGSPTSYYDVFKHALAFLRQKIDIPLNNQIWQKLGPYSSQLNIDEVENIDKTWDQISKIIGIPVETVKSAIVPVKDLYVILDHTRTVFMIIQDGSLPSNVGGGSNCRNILRRVFAILKKNGWWEKLGKVQGLLQLFQYHKKDLSELYGKFQPYKSFDSIIRIELKRWESTDQNQQKKLLTLFQKKKKNLAIDDWILAMQSWGIPADAISQITGLPIPGNLYYEIETRNEKIVKAEEVILYNTTSYPQTENLYYKDHRQLKFQAKIVGILNNAEKQKKQQTNIVILDKSVFYPTSGGQQNDVGSLTINDKTYQVLDAQKIGKCVLHFLDGEVSKDLVGTVITGEINAERRDTLRKFHTGTHVVFAACRRVLGPHIWQNGAKKTQTNAHLDVTHFTSLTKQEQQAIQNEANKIVLSGKRVNKSFMDKAEAQKIYGFRLYQGGIVPGNNLRVVNIEDTDVEACCGTHCDNTNQIGWIKIYKTTRISDGILRLYYVAGPKVLPLLNSETTIINNLKDLWGINQNQIVDTAERFFKDYKKFENESIEQKSSLLELQIKFLIQSKHDKGLIDSLQKIPTLYFSQTNKYLKSLSEAKKSIVFVGDKYIFGILTNKQHLDLQKLRAFLIQEGNTQEILSKKFNVSEKAKNTKKKESVNVEGSTQFNFVGEFKTKRMIEFFVKAQYYQI